MSTKHPIRIMLLDDHPFMLHGLEACLGTAHDIQILGSFSTSQSLILALSSQPVDLVLLDYSLGPDEVDGLNLVRALKIRFPAVRLLVISALHNPATVTMVMRCGADGFIGKEVDTSQLPVAVRKVASGKPYLSDGMTELLYDHDISTDDHKVPSLKSDISSESILTNSSSLTVREHEVLRCCLDGLSVTQIAEKFSRSIKTISTQKQSAFKKLGLRSDNELFKMRHQLDGL
ncbi:response regulator transcription factor [Pseudomonas sp. IPO3774]|uniref:response regulator transcription factor n=1 Tax=Pseudomonas sp. IPO3774 TaxID=2738826 RepID=UPI0015A2447C|nr:response regulator transcription factor [Pseudomonas sp. IPO3774]NWD65964.1 response regulator transcription factor [Pseudomonas sp. IPO3774]